MISTQAENRDKDREYGLGKGLNMGTERAVRGTAKREDDKETLTGT